MNFAEVEKERWKENNYTWLMIGAMILWYSVKLLNAFSTAAVYDWEMKTRTIDFQNLTILYWNTALFCGILISGLYMSSRLFWITENGERVFLMRKYDLAPVTRKDIYYCKARIFVKNMAGYLFFSLAIYVLTLLLYGVEINMLQTLLCFAGAVAVAGILMAVLFGLALVQDFRSIQKKRM